MIVDGDIPQAENPSLERITVINWENQNTNFDISNKSIQFLNAAGTMRVESEQICSLTHPPIKQIENKLVTVLEGTVVISGAEGTSSFKAGETFYIKKDSEISMETGLKTKMINVCYQMP